MTRNIAKKLITFVVLTAFCSTFLQFASANSGNSVLKGINVLERVDNNIDKAKGKYKQLNEKVSFTKELIEGAKEQISTLEGQITGLEDEIKEINQEIVYVTKMIQEKENRIKLTEKELKEKQEELKVQEELLDEYFKLLYRKEGQFLSKNKDVSMLKLLLSDSTVGDNINESRYYTILEKTGHNIIRELQNVEEELKDLSLNLINEKKELKDMKEALVFKEEELVRQRVAKERLLKETQGEEEIYQELLAESLEQQQDVIRVIDDLANNRDSIEGELHGLKAKLGDKTYKMLANGESENGFWPQLYDEYGNLLLHWPIEPKKGLSAYFDDDNYVAIFGVEHQAVDIPAPQGSVFYAPANGVVYKAVDNGYGYSYIVLAHEQGISTVYGHVSGFLVEEGDAVFAGEALGLIGGTPGTLGAGLRTTGPHLHFEVHEDGTKVDPMNYLIDYDQFDYDFEEEDSYDVEFDDIDFLEFEKEFLEQEGTIKLQSEKVPRK